MKKLIALAAFLAACSNTPGATLARGYIFRGTAAGIAGQYDANDNAKILVGDGNDLNSVSMSGAMTINSSGATTLSANYAEAGVQASLADHTSVDFTKEPWVPMFAKTTLAIWTEADTQEDFFRTSLTGRYFEFFQDGANFVDANLFTPTSYGWVMPGPDATDMGWQLTEGIVLGHARAYTTGTDAFYMRAAFYISQRDEFTELMVGFRKLGAYAVADDATELATAYDDKVIYGIEGAAGVLNRYTSKATVDVGPTACTHAAAANNDILAIEVRVSAGGVATVKFGTATPGGTTAAQIQSGVASAYLGLASDALCNAAFTMTGGISVVPTIFFASANGTAANANSLVNYYAGLQ